MVSKAVIEEFATLLEAQAREQEYQDFLEEHTEFIPREFIQNHGIHFRLALRKVPFGNQLVSDFVYLAKSSDNWHIVLVEIEKPSSRFFKDNSTKFHADFVHAQQQINEWRAWFSSPDNLAYFANTTLRPVRNFNPRLFQNPCTPKYVLVLGRRAEYQNNGQRQDLVRSVEQDDFHIVSYDSVLENAINNRPLYLGVLKKDFVDIYTERFIDDELLAVMDPSQLRITDALRSDAIAKKDLWFIHSTFERYAIEDNLPKVGRLPDQ